MQGSTTAQEQTRGEYEVSVLTFVGFASHTPDSTRATGCPSSTAPRSIHDSPSSPAAAHPQPPRDPFMTHRRLPPQPHRHPHLHRMPLGGPTQPPLRPSRTAQLLRHDPLRPRHRALASLLPIMLLPHCPRQLRQQLLLKPCVTQTPSPPHRPPLHGLPPIATVQDVIDRPRVLKTEVACHAARLTQNPSPSIVRTDTVLNGSMPRQATIRGW
jgi:hypothetical protein